MGEPIDIILDFAEIKSDKSIKTRGRVVLGYLSALYESDIDLTVRIYFKRDEGMDYEQTEDFIFPSTQKRIFYKLPLGLTVIDFYPEVISSVKNYKITSLKIHTKPSITGKFS